MLLGGGGGGSSVFMAGGVKLETGKLEHVLAQLLPHSCHESSVLLMDESKPCQVQTLSMLFLLQASPKNFCVFSWMGVLGFLTELVTANPTVEL